MSTKQTENRPDLNALAFEYVTGTLRGDRRQAVQQRLRNNVELAAEVRFWEQQLMAFHSSTPERTPNPNNWDAIQAAINNNAAETKGAATSDRHLAPWHHAYIKIQRAFHDWQSTYWPLRPAALAMLWAILATAYILQSPNQPSEFAPDYVAVLTQPNSDQPLLTALTHSDGGELHLQWQQTPPGTPALQVPSNVSWQLWAKSRRDGQIRSLMVFNGKPDARMPLDQAQIRLIRDAKDLILTREESGGSAIDEPSDDLLARGACVRLSIETS